MRYRPRENEPPLLISVEEAAYMLGVSRGTAYMLASDGRLPTMRFGRCVRVHLKRLEQMIDAQSGNSG